MKKYLFMVMIAVMMLSGSTTVNAQVAQNGKERVHLTVDQIIQKRTEKMVQTLMLDDATSAKFIPVYSQYLKEKMDHDLKQRLETLFQPSTEFLES